MEIKIGGKTRFENLLKQLFHSSLLVDLPQVDLMNLLGREAAVFEGASDEVARGRPSSGGY